MKLTIGALLTSIWASMDPGCGLGSNVASNGGTNGSNPIDTGSIPLVSCGSLGMHVFCDDFEDGTLPGRFDSQTTSAGTLALDSKLALSGSHALLATTDHLTTGTRTLARLHKDLHSSGTRFVLSFSEYVDPNCIGPSDRVDSGAIVTNDNRYFLAVGHGGGADQIVETSLENGVYVQSHVLKSRIPTGRWVKIVLDADLVKKKVTLSIDGASAAQDEPLMYAPANSHQTPGVEAGTLTDNLAGPSACSVRTDDVVFDMSP